MSLKKVLLGSIPLLIVILGITYPISRFDDIASSLVAWGTLMLAIATFTLIKHSHDQERRSREAELLKETRDKQERLLNEIIDWAIDMSRCDVPLDPAFTHVEDSEQSRRLVHVLISNEEVNVNARWGKGQYLITAILPNWSDLRKVAEALYNDSGKLIDLLRKSRDAVRDSRPDAFEQINVEVAEQKGKILDSVTKVTSEAVTVRETIFGIEAKHKN